MGNRLLLKDGFMIKHSSGRLITGSMDDIYRYDGLSDHWPFDGDLTGQFGNDASIQQQGIDFDYVNGIINECIDASSAGGSPTVVRITNLDFLNTGPWSVSFWFKTNKIATHGRIININASTYLDQPTEALGVLSGYLSFERLENNPSPPYSDVMVEILDGAISNNTWYHIVWSMDTDKKYKIWKNHVLVLNGTKSRVLDKNYKNIFLFGGNVNEYYTQSWDGCIDDVWVYNKVLSQNQVDFLYSLGT